MHYSGEIFDLGRVSDVCWEVFELGRKADIVAHIIVVFPVVTLLSFPNMAMLAAAVVAAAGRDPAVDRSLRSVFGKCVVC